LTDLLTDGIKSLTNLGLTPTQAKIYLASLQTGPATAKVISQASKIAREDVYRTLPSLQALGLITKHISSPAKYEAEKPKNAIAILLSKKEKEHLELREKASEALENLTKHPFVSDSGNDESIMFITNEENVHFAIDSTRKAKRTLDFTTRYNLFLHTMNKLQFGLYIKEMYKAAQRGVKFRMILDRPKNTTPVSKLSFQVSYSKALVSSPNFEYRYVESPIDCILILYDNEKCLIETSKERDVEVSPFLATNNQVLVKLCRSYFEKTWESGINIDKVYAIPKTN
jgi:Fe2+ or Zn2+ uptake regulation protein